jgi:hypothetical protein
MVTILWQEVGKGVETETGATVEEKEFNKYDIINLNVLLNGLHT